MYSWFLIMRMLVSVPTTPEKMQDMTTTTMMMNKMTKLTHGEDASEDDGGEDEDNDGGSPENADQLPYKELPLESHH